MIALTRINKQQGLYKINYVHYPNFVSFIPDLNFNVYIKISIKITKNKAVWFENVTKILNDMKNINRFKQGAMVSAHYQPKVASRFNTERGE